MLMVLLGINAALLLVINNFSWQGPSRRIFGGRPDRGPLIEGACKLVFGESHCRRPGGGPGSRCPGGVVVSGPSECSALSAV